MALNTLFLPIVGASVAPLRNLVAAPRLTIGCELALNRARQVRNNSCLVADELQQFKL